MNYYKCPNCTSNLVFVYQYNQWYCNSCRRYPYLPPQVKPQPPTSNSQPNQCPRCSSQLRFVHQYNNYWCDRCRSYQAPGRMTPSRSTRSISDDDDDSDFDYTPRFHVGISSGKRKKSRHKKIGYQSPFSHDDEDEEDNLPDRFRCSSSSDSFRRRGDRVFASSSRIGKISGDEEYHIRGDRLISTSDGRAKYRIRGDRLYEI